MKTPRKLGLVAVVVFVISHFLPAYGEGSGFDCSWVCWIMVLGPNHTEILSSGWFCYLAFILSNILFIGLVVALFVTKKRRRLRLAVSIVCFLHVLSWLVMHIFSQPAQIALIKVGYYLWLSAYSLLVAAHLRKAPDESLESIPLAGSVV